MSTEGERLVYDYLSRVGDLAQATPLSSAERLALVVTLRQEIDARRGGGEPTPGAVRRVLNGIGAPDEVVRRAVGENGYAPPPPPAAATPTPTVVPPRPSEPPQVPASAPASDRADLTKKPPANRRAGGARVGRSGGDPGELPGWSAVYEPDFLDVLNDNVPPQPSGPVDPLPGPSPDADPAPVPEPPAGRPRRGLLGRRPRVAAPAASAGRRRLPPPLDLLGVVALLAGGVLGLWYLALVGWFLAYQSRVLGRRVGAVIGLWLPVALAAAFGIWVYRQGTGPHHTLPDGAVHRAFTDWLRTASLVSGVALAWRSRR